VRATAFVACLEDQAESRECGCSTVDSKPSADMGCPCGQPCDGMQDDWKERIKLKSNPT